jgi:hypothetical protein
MGRFGKPLEAAEDVLQPCSDKSSFTSGNMSACTAGPSSAPNLAE